MSDTQQPTATKNTTIYQLLLLIQTAPFFQSLRAFWKINSVKMWWLMLLCLACTGAFFTSKSTKQTSCLKRPLLRLLPSRLPLLTRLPSCLPPSDQHSKVNTPLKLGIGVEAPLLHLEAPLLRLVSVRWWSLHWAFHWAEAGGAWRRLTRKQWHSSAAIVVLLWIEEAKGKTGYRQQHARSWGSTKLWGPYEEKSDAHGLALFLEAANRCCKWNEWRQMKAACECTHIQRNPRSQHCKHFSFPA